MKQTKFFSPPYGDVILNPDLLFLEILVLYVNDEYWCSGSGDSYIEYEDEAKTSRIEILFSLEYGFYLRFQAWQEDYHSLGLGDFTNTVTVYVGGDPLLLPTKFFITREQALLVVKEFCQTGKRINKINWGKDEDINWNYGFEE